jgi:hypothetical protein
MSNQYKGRIVEIEKHQNRATYIKQGVQKQDQPKYANYPGGNGTYVTGGEYLGTVLNVKISVYDLGHCLTFDVYEDVLSYIGKSRISPQILSRIESHEGDKVTLVSEDGRNFTFDIRQILD